jgi:hypothetical protein
VFRIVASLRDVVWPGVAPWKPAAALALSLAAGIAAGSYFPFDELVSPDLADQSASVAFDAPPAFDLGEESS